MGTQSPRVLLVQLGSAVEESLLSDTPCNHTIAQVTSLYPTLRVKTAASALRSIRQHKPAAIYILDGGVSKPKFANFQARLAQYVREGGALIFGNLFSSFVTPPDMGKMFRSFGFQWEFGNYHRTDFALNPAMQSMFKEASFNGLEREYSMKAVHLKGVDKDAKVYVPTPESMTQSRVFPPEYVDRSQCPAVFAKYGEGRVGYVGDVNNEEGSRLLIMAMLGIFVSFQTSRKKGVG
ncbi:MAG: hypothetical protein Q9217_005164 [Psora testacea]